MRILRYSEDQPRDDHGRFGEGGGIDVGGKADYSNEKLSGALADVMSQAEAMENAGKDEGKTYEALTHMGSALSANINSKEPENNRLAVAFNSDGKIVGAGSLWVNKDKTEATITHVGSIQPGAGRAVVEKLLAQAREYSKVTTVKLTSSEYANSMSFYDKFGFKDAGGNIGAHGEKDMELKITRSIEDYVAELFERAAKLADTPGGLPTVVYFMRHGQTDSDAQNLFGGQTMEDMNAAGIADMRAAIADVISNLDFDLVFSDGLLRTHHSAEMVLPYSKSATEVIVNANATAWGCGDLSGQLKTAETIEKKKFFVMNPTVVPPGPNAESIQHSEHRWLAFLAYVVSLTPPGSASFCMCHSSGIKVISKTYGTRIKVNPGGIVRMTITAEGITFDVLRNGLPETITPDAEDERKRLMLAQRKKLIFARSKSYADAGTYNEGDEAVRRQLAAEMTQYAESGTAFDSKGDYLCGTCSQMALPSACGVVSGTIKPDDMSCRYWVKDIPLVQLEMKFKPKAAGLTERPNEKGFGCKRCEYGSEAKTADSAGRKSWCSWWGMHVLANACCAMNEGPDDIAIKN